jgi:hypothetical protein
MTSFRGGATSSPTMPKWATTLNMHAKFGGWTIEIVRRMADPIGVEVSRAAVSSNTPWPGSIASAALPKTSRQQLPVPKYGSIWPWSNFH